MAIRSIGGGDLGAKLTTTCNVLSTHQDTIALNDLVVWDGTANWTVNSAADNTDVGICGRVVWMNEVSSVCTVAWFGWNRIIKQNASGLQTLLAQGKTAQVHTADIYASGLASIAAHNLIVAAETGFTYVALR